MKDFRWVWFHSSLSLYCFILLWETSFEWSLSNLATSLLTGFCEVVLHLSDAWLHSHLSEGLHLQTGVFTSSAWKWLFCFPELFRRRIPILFVFLQLMTSLFKRNWSTVLLKYNVIGMNFSFIYNIHTIIWCLPSLIKLLVYSPKCQEWMCFSLFHTFKQYFSC